MTLGLEDFAGDWALSRRIEDRQGGLSGMLDGLARLVPAGLGLRYSEDGTLVLDRGGRFAATRAYLWRSDGAGIAVFFDDGRPFHRFDPEGAARGTDHLCGSDLYRVAYDFTRWPDWSARFDVSGPNKDYTLTSRYRRAG